MCERGKGIRERRECKCICGCKGASLHASLPPIHPQVVRTLHVQVHVLLRLLVLVPLMPMSMPMSVVAMATAMAVMMMVAVMVVVVVVLVAAASSVPTPTLLLPSLLHRRGGSGDRGRAVVVVAAVRVGVDRVLHAGGRDTAAAPLRRRARGGGAGRRLRVAGGIQSSVLSLPLIRCFPLLQRRRRRLAVLPTMAVAVAAAVAVAVVVVVVVMVAAFVLVLVPPASVAVPGGCGRGRMVVRMG